jgi:HicB_like antitoxin of bacterial toxin-antitoxin system
MKLIEKGSTMRYPVMLKYPKGESYADIELLDFQHSIRIGSSDTDQVMEEVRRCMEEIVIRLMDQGASIPKPTLIKNWQLKIKDADAIWTLIDIHPDFFSDEMERINVSIAKRVLARLDSQAKKMGKTRSAAIAQMAMTYECEGLYDQWIRSAL